MIINFLASRGCGLPRRGQITALNCDNVSSIPLNIPSDAAGDPLGSANPVKGLATVPSGPVEPIAGKPMPPPPPHKRSLLDTVEHYISKLTSRSVFWHRIGSLIWLPYAFRSGIKMKRMDANTFSAILPFRRFNRNWYNAMAGAALLANSEIAGGTYIYGKCGGDYTVVCKNLQYRFLRPCMGPAIYRINPLGDLDALLASGREFNLDLELEVFQQLPTKGLGKEVRVGRCQATFHITPKSLHRLRAARRAAP